VCLCVWLHLLRNKLYINFLQASSLPEWRRIYPANNFVFMPKWHCAVTSSQGTQDLLGNVPHTAAISDQHCWTDTIGVTSWLVPQDGAPFVTTAVTAVASSVFSGSSSAEVCGCSPQMGVLLTILTIRLKRLSNIDDTVSDDNDNTSRWWQIKQFY